MDFNRLLFFWPISSGTKRLKLFLSKILNSFNVRFNVTNIVFMQEYIHTNLKVIKKHLKKRSINLSKINSLSIMEEFKEWNEDPSFDKELIWTLPDLTRIERYKNFCRAIKKEIR